jgi:hypothetical protein
MTAELSTTERLFLIQIRSLLLKCVDLIERRAGLGRYKGAPQPVTLGASDNIAGAVLAEDQPPGQFAG